MIYIYAPFLPHKCGKSEPDGMQLRFKNAKTGSLSLFFLQNVFTNRLKCVKINTIAEAKPFAALPANVLIVSK